MAKATPTVLVSRFPEASLSRPLNFTRRGTPGATLGCAGACADCPKARTQIIDERITSVSCVRKRKQILNGPPIAMWRKDLHYLTILSSNTGFPPENQMQIGGQTLIG